MPMGGVYSSIGTNGVLMADPAVIHFGGFEPGKAFRQVMRIVNTSPVSRRLHIIPPTTSFFKVSGMACRGMHAWARMA